MAVQMTDGPLKVAPFAILLITVFNDGAGGGGVAGVVVNIDTDGDSFPAASTAETI